MHINDRIYRLFHPEQFGIMPLLADEKIQLIIADQYFLKNDDLQAIKLLDDLEKRICHRNGLDKLPSPSIDEVFHQTKKRAKIALYA